MDASSIRPVQEGDCSHQGTTKTLWMWVVMESTSAEGERGVGGMDPAGAGGGVVKPGRAGCSQMTMMTSGPHSALVV